MLNIARPVSVIFAAAAFVATVAGLLGGLTPLTRAPDQASLAIGRHSISALDIVTTALVAAALFALVRLTVKPVNRSIQPTSLDSGSGRESVCQQGTINGVRET